MTSAKPPAALALKRWLDRQGMTLQEFADAIECTRSTVAGWVHGKRRPMPKRAEQIERLTCGLVRRTEWGGGRQRAWTTAEDDDLPRLHAAGWNDRKIAERFNRTVSSVRSRRCMFGIVRKHWRSAAITEAPVDALIAELRSRGYVVNEAPSHSGVMSL